MTAEQKHCARCDATPAPETRVLWHFCKNCAAIYDASIPGDFALFINAMKPNAAAVRREKLNPRASAAGGSRVTLTIAPAK